LRQAAAHRLPVRGVLTRGRDLVIIPIVEVCLYLEFLIVTPELLARYEARAKIIKALAHPTRLFIVDELARSGPRCVCELTEMVGADMSTVSKHLAVLKSAGLVQDAKRGSQVYYQLRVQCIVNFFTCVESVLQANVDEQQRLLAELQSPQVVGRS